MSRDSSAFNMIFIVYRAKYSITNHLGKKEAGEFVSVGHDSVNLEKKIHLNSLDENTIEMRQDDGKFGYSYSF